MDNETINYLRQVYDVTEGAFVNTDGDLVVDERYGGCGNYETRIRKATKNDQIFFAVRDTINKYESKLELAAAERQYRYLKERFKGRNDL